MNLGADPEVLPRYRDPLTQAEVQCLVQSLRTICSAQTCRGGDDEVRQAPDPARIKRIYAPWLAIAGSISSGQARS